MSTEHLKAWNQWVLIINNILFTILTINNYKAQTAEISVFSVTQFVDECYQIKEIKFDFQTF